MTGPARPGLASGTPPVVVALGGNAMQQPGDSGEIGLQRGRMLATAGHLARLGNVPLVITHGNGPQVGDALTRAELAAEVLPGVPLDTLGAGTQGTLGYLIQEGLDTALADAGIDRPTATVLTRTLVDAGDPAFGRPSKPIGRFLSEADARVRMVSDHWEMREDAGRGWRRVVPSPQPREIVEEAAIRSLLEAGIIVIAVGGGGIPVVREADGRLRGVEAVIDKDLASALLANRLGAEVLMILTGVEYVAVDWGRPGQRDLHDLSLGELTTLLEQRQFAAGSMEPKLRAIAKFLETGGARAVVTSPEMSAKGLDGEAGTQIRP